MKAKHLTKNAMSHKLVFLAVGIAIAIIAAFSICAPSQAKAEDLNADPQWKLVDKTGGKLTPQFWNIFDPVVEGPAIYHDSWTFESSAYDVIKTYFSDIQNINVAYTSVTRDGKYYCNLLFIIKAHLTGKTTKEWCLNFQCVPTDNILDCCWGIDGEKLLTNLVEEEKFYSLNPGETYTFTLLHDTAPGTNISGNVWDDESDMPVPFANVVYCQYNPWWDMYLPVEGVEAVKTDMWGWYTLEGITEEMLPGKVFVYDGINKIGESDTIWFLPEDMETLYMWPILINQEQPDPPVPPTPPDPPYPPGPNPPEPVPPVPPAPAPTPDNPGGGIAQTGDVTPFAAFAGLAIIAALGCGVALRKEY